MKPRTISAGLLGLAILVAAAFLGTASAPASTPATSTVTVPVTAGQTATDTWTGVAMAGVNPASDCAPLSSSPIDEHVVTINVTPTTYTTLNAAFTFTINWTPASGSNATSDLILTLVGPTGTRSTRATAATRLSRSARRTSLQAPTTFSSAASSTPALSPTTRN